MRIVCISASRVPSEAANSLQAMKACQALVQTGHDVTLLVPGAPSGVTVQRLREHYGLALTFPIGWLPGPRRLFPSRAIMRLRSLNPDLLYVWPLQAAALGALRHIPVILEMHDLPSGRIGPLWYRLFLGARGARRVLTITTALRDALAEKYGSRLPPAGMILAPNGVDLERFSALPGPRSARRQLGLPEKPTVACTGHLYAGRGADLFLELACSFPQANFLWVGGRPQEVTAWQARSGSLGLQNVTFTGFVSNNCLPLYQAAADILLMPYGRVIAISSGMGHSARVASPMKMFEYMASGRAILTSDLPVIREVLDETTAVFCPPEEFEAWREALNALLADQTRRQALGRRARAQVEQYTWIRRAERALEGFPPH
ncbi:MAG: glycosyltransferase family 4 protein [Anaerolineales bacterium]|nr:glycosyltransferase family 4 protein [Anaerolineales bacterium]